jgi:hypothetical protein
VLKEREAVLIRILGALEPPHPDPLPRGEREKPSAETSSEKGRNRPETSPGRKRERPIICGKGARTTVSLHPGERVGTSQHPLSPRGRGLG